MLALAASLVYRIWGQQLMQAAMVPSAKFVPQKALVSHTYASPTMWYARPDIRQNNPALWTPAGVTTDGSGQAAIFFIHPTSSLERSKWNAPLDDKESRSEEHTSELQSLMRLSYAVFCLKKKKN